MIGPVLAALAVAALAAACARVPDLVGRNDLVILLPSPDGRPGSLTVSEGGRTAALDRPYDAARIRRGLDATSVTPAEVDMRFGPALAALPGRPATFLLYFETGTDELTAESRQEVQGIFAEIARRPAPEIVVIGHTDRVGTVPYNDGLSRQRAEAVRRELLRLGIPPERIQVAGRGEREPLVPTDDEVAEPRNRRVEINVR